MAQWLERGFNLYSFPLCFQLELNWATTKMVSAALEKSNPVPDQYADNN